MVWYGDTSLKKVQPQVIMNCQPNSYMIPTLSAPLPKTHVILTTYLLWIWITYKSLNLVFSAVLRWIHEPARMFPSFLLGLYSKLCNAAFTIFFIVFMHAGPKHPTQVISSDFLRKKIVSLTFSEFSMLPIDGVIWAKSLPKTN